MGINVNRFINYWDIFRLGKRKPKTITEFLSSLWLDSGIDTMKMTIERGTETIITTDFAILKEGDSLRFDVTPLAYYFVFKELKYTKNALNPDFNQGTKVEEPLSTYRFNVTKELAEQYKQNNGLAWKAFADFDPEHPVTGTSIVVVAPEQGGTVEYAWYPYSDFISSSETKEPCTIPNDAFNRVAPGSAVKVGEIANVYKMSKMQPISTSLGFESSGSSVYKYKGSSPLSVNTLIYDTIYIRHKEEGIEEGFEKFVKVDRAPLSVGQFMVSEQNVLYIGTDYDASQWSFNRTEDGIYAATTSTASQLIEYVFATKMVPYTEGGYSMVDIVNSKAANIKDQEVSLYEFELLYSLMEYDVRKQPSIRAIYNTNIIDDLDTAGSGKIFGDYFFGGQVIAPKFFKSGTNKALCMTMNGAEGGYRAVPYNFTIAGVPREIEGMYEIERNSDFYFEAYEYVLTDCGIGHNTLIPTGRTFDDIQVKLYDMMGQEEEPTPFDIFSVHRRTTGFEDYEFSIKNKIQGKDFIQMKMLTAGSNPREFAFQKRIPIATYSSLGYIPNEEFYTETLNKMGPFDYYQTGENYQVSTKSWIQDFDEASKESDFLTFDCYKYKRIYSPYETAVDKYDYKITDENFNLPITEAILEQYKGKGLTFKKFYKPKIDDVSQGSFGIVYTGSNINDEHLNYFIRLYKKGAAASARDLLYDSSTGGNPHGFIFDQTCGQVLFTLNGYDYINPDPIEIEFLYRIDSMEEQSTAYISSLSRILQYKNYGDQTIHEARYSEFTNAGKETVGEYEYIKVNGYYVNWDGKRSPTDASGTYYFCPEMFHKDDNVLVTKLSFYSESRITGAPVLYCQNVEHWDDSGSYDIYDYQEELPLGENVSSEMHLRRIAIRPNDDFSVFTKLDYAAGTTLSTDPNNHYIQIGYSDDGTVNRLCWDKDGEQKMPISCNTSDWNTRKTLAWKNFSLKTFPNLQNRIRADIMAGKDPTITLIVVRW